MTRQHQCSPAQGLRSLLTAWPAWLGLMLAGCGAAQGYGHLVLTDPLLGGMKAAVVAVPAGWSAQGTVSRGTCGMFRGRRGGQPVPLLRAVSPDGQMQYRMMPALAWQWANPRYTNPQLRQFMARQAPHQAPGCLPIFAPISAAQFVRLYAQHLRGVSIVGAAPVPPALQAAAARVANAGNAARGTPFKDTHTFDVASIRVESDARGQRHDGLLTAVVKCYKIAFPVPSGGCSASTQILLAPVGKLGEVSRLIASLPPVQWNRQYVAAIHHVTRREFVRIERANQQQWNRRDRIAAKQDRARSIASHQAFMQQQASQQRQHDAVLSQMQSSTQSSMNNANAAMNARSTAASDWQDYALDQQTVRGSNGTQKVSSAYSNTWSNGWGGTAQTNDPNANPNGVVKGNWTRDQKVHGNGQPW